MRFTLATAVVLAALALFSFQVPQRQAAPLAGPCFTSLVESDQFSVPALPARVPASELVGVRLVGLHVGFGFQYGMENLSAQEVGVVTTRRYIAHEIRGVGQTFPHPVVAPSTSEMGPSSTLEPYDGTQDAIEFDPYSPTSPVPAGPSGYWGGQPPTDATFGDQQLWYFAHVHPMGVDYWHGNAAGRVPLEYRPRGEWEYLSATNGLPSGHWSAWVDRINGTILGIDSIVYELADGSDIVLPVR